MEVSGTKLPRNAPCHCGSGLKFKRCHGAIALRPAIPDERRDTVFRAIAEQQRSGKNWVAHAGRVPPPVSIQVDELRLVLGAGMQIWMPFNHPFDPYLEEFMKLRMGAKWGTEEIARPWQSRHPLLQWYEAFCREHNANLLGNGQASTWEASGFGSAYLWTAWDLWTLAQVGSLPDEKVARLKIKRQFQGTRYELYVAAAFARAGFHVDWIDETDPTRKHSDFVATHTATGHKYSVEVKSRHRPGVLGQSRLRDTASETAIEIQHLLKDALSKSADFPRIVVLDLNASLKQTQAEEWQPLVAAVRDQVMALQRSITSKSALLLITNRPDHYHGEEIGRGGGGVLAGAFNTPEFHALGEATSFDPKVVDHFWSRVAEKWPGFAAAFSSLQNLKQWPHEFP
jgi:hypothetical protein